VSTFISPQLQILANDVREWSMAELRPLGRQADREHTPPPAAVKSFENAPFSGSPLSGIVEVDPQRGISEGRYLVATTVIESGCYGDVLFVIASPGGGIGGRVVELIGTSEQIDRWTGGLVRGDFHFSGFALTEHGAGSDAASLRTSARLEGDRWIINGTKMFCTGGAVSDFIVVFATVDPSQRHRGIRAFVVEKDAVGFSVSKANESKLGCRSLLTSELVFDDVSVPLDHCLGRPEDQIRSFATALSTLNSTRHQVASMACGIGQAVLDELTPRLNEMRLSFAPRRWSRIQSDVRAMNAALERGRLLARRAAWRIDHGLSFDREAAMAKAYIPPIVERITLRAIEFLGPEGWSEELPFEKWHRDIKILDIWEGTGNIQRRTVARSLMAAR
jgi:acyl-CoA dehydrogenase